MLTKNFNFNCLKPIYRDRVIPSSNDVLNIIWNGDANNSSGYSQGARDFLFALNENPRINLQYTRKICVKSDGIDKSLNDKIMAIANNKIGTPYISVVYNIANRFFIDPKAVLNIGYTVFECEKIPQYLIPSCNQMDAIFTPTQFSKRIIEKNGVIVPIFVIPYCHEIERFENVGKYNIKNLKGFNFLFLSEMTPRKGWDHLVQAFVEEFGVGEDVS
ncbi:MAG: glycosyltransferase, partial [bacterium]